jgi:RNA polymerase sigma-70 factor (ECF subfamily)
MKTTTEQIWNDFHKEIYFFINKRIKNKDISEDILQDVFIKIHLKYQTLESKDKLVSWIYQITRNSIYDHFRSTKFFDEIPEDLNESELNHHIADEFVQCLKPMINRLPEIYQDAILQTELGNLKQKELAEKLNISYSAAKSRVQRGREHLLNLFKLCCDITSENYKSENDNHTKENCSMCN